MYMYINITKISGNKNYPTLWNSKVEIPLPWQKNGHSPVIHMYGWRPGTFGYALIGSRRESFTQHCQIGGWDVGPKMGWVARRSNLIRKVWDKVNYRLLGIIKQVSPLLLRLWDSSINHPDQVTSTLSFYLF